MGVGHKMEGEMIDREKQQAVFQAQLDQWRGEVSTLKAKASTALATAQEAINRQAAMTKEIKELERNIDEGEKKLAELAEASDDTWESIKESVESAWDGLKSAVGKAVERSGR